MDDHHYSVDRELWTDRKGNEHMSDYWQIRCDPCKWRGERITNPSRRQSRARVREWENHAAIQS